MKTKAIGIVYLLLAFAVQAATAPAIIPAPQKMELRNGHFQLGPDTSIYVDAASRKTGEFLANKLRPSTGYKLKVLAKSSTKAVASSGIVLITQSANTNLGPEGYEFTVQTNTVVIRAPTQAGLFYGAQTLRQLLPPQIYSTNVVADGNWQMPSVQIEDWPRFKWRGLMLDVSRHFYGKQEVERLLDLMAQYKLNRFHWHLVDDQGWRIQIKQYPKLTEIGAWRTNSALMPPLPLGEDGQPQNIHPDWANPPASDFGPDGRYGGFYTQDDIREVVAYAAARHITIVPEIEMPGHSVAALAAYPQFGCTGQSYSTDVGAGVLNGIYNPANPQTFKFLEAVLTEVFQLFPGKYIHIGGDEVKKEYWAKNPECQALMKREGLKNEEELQSWFIRRIEKFVNAHDHTLIGWSEILQGGLAQNAVVMDWIGGGKEAASQGHDVIMTPTGYCYLDHYQSQDHVIEPRAIGGYLPLRKVYSFDPIPKELSPQFESHILGAQGNLWTEYIASPAHVEYMLFPRLCALSEVAWSSTNARNWPDFQRRLATDEKRLNELQVNYRNKPSVRIAEWTPSEISATNTLLTWNVTDQIKGPGEYRVTFSYRHGDKGLTIRNLALLANGHEIDHDAHQGFTGARPKNPVYLLKLPTGQADAKYVLQAAVSGEDGTDSYGDVSWVFVPDNAKLPIGGTADKR